MIDVVNGPLYCGHTLPGGYTVQYRHAQMVTLLLHQQGSFARCRHIERRVNAVMLRAAARERIRGLQQLLNDRHLRDERPMLQTKLEDEILQNGSLAEVKRLVADRLAQAPDASPAERSLNLNAFAYRLASEHPTRHLDYAIALVDQSLELDTTAFNMDTKGWTLFHMGRHEEALSWIERSLALLQTRCKESERLAHAEGLAHRGAILWALKQRSGALHDWVRAERLTPDDGWKSTIPNWTALRPVVEAFGAQLPASEDVPLACQEPADRPEAAAREETP